jgi:Tol biopolymer transport system component
MSLMTRTAPPSVSTSRRSRAPSKAMLAAIALTLSLLGSCSNDDPGQSSSTAPAQSHSDATATPVIGDGEEWIAYQGVEPGIKLTRPDGTGSHVILGPPGDQNHPDWSPDGAEIAYVQYDGTKSTVMITDLQGNNPRPLVNTALGRLDDLFWENPAWSRDGTEIAMVGYDGDPNQTLPARSVLAIADVLTGELTVIDELSSADGQLHSFPRWSPDGQAMVLNIDRFDGHELTGATVDVLRRKGSGWSTPESITELGPFSRVDWHPTDDLIVFADNDIGGVESTDEPTNLYTVRSDGSNLSQMTSFGPGEARASQPTWTSDGRILFTYVTGDNDEVREVAMMNADGSGRTVVVPADEIGQYNRPHPRMRPTG